jgi:peroxisomal 3,2-trans-enoyl-CoA isomerase
MPAALVAHSDFIYCVPNTFLLTPFASLGLIPEGVSSLAFAARMGIAKAKEALIAGKRLSSKELLDAGFVNQIFDCASGDDGTFRRLVLEEIGRVFHFDLNASGMLKTKDLISRGFREQLDAQSVEEVFGALSRSVAGIPQKEFEKKRLKLAESKSKSKL